MHTFTLRDADGKTHTYEVSPHPADEGEKIMWELDALAAGPLAGLVGAIVEGMGEGAKVSSVLDVGLYGIDFVAVGEGLRKACLSMPALRPRILLHTIRDGKRLSDADYFATAYTRNYLELQRAMWEVVSYNRFLPLSVIYDFARAVKETAPKGAEPPAPS